MEPAITEFAAKYIDVEFAKVEVDELDVCLFYHLKFLYIHSLMVACLEQWLINGYYQQDVAQEFGVQAMPTFILIKKRKRS